MDEKAENNVYRFDRFTLDLYRGILSDGGAAVPLRPKVLLALTHLAKNMGRVVPKAELMDNIWPSVTVSDDSLTQVVKDLRKALGDASATLVRTIPGRGYLLDGGAEPALAVAHHPTAAVLRFRNVGGDPSRAGVVDGITEDIIDRLTLFRSVTMLGRTTCFSIDPAEERRALSQRLALDYIVEGSVGAAGNDVVIFVELTEAATGRQLWNQRYTARDTDVFSVQSEIATQIVNRLVARIDDAARIRASRRPAASLAAYELCLQGLAFARGRGWTGEAIGLFEAAIAKDPRYGLAHSYLALELIPANGDTPPDALRAAVTFAAKGVALDPEESRCHRMLGLVRLAARQHDAAEGHFRRAYELNPFDADVLMQTGFAKVLRGKPVEGRAWMDLALRLNPIHPDWYLQDYTVALYFGGQYREAAEGLERRPMLLPRERAFVAACYAQAGELTLARGHIAQVLAEDPSFDLERGVFIGWYNEHEADREHLLEGVRVALRATAA